MAPSRHGVVLSKPADKIIQPVGYCARLVKWKSAEPDFVTFESTISAQLICPSIGTYAHRRAQASAGWHRLRERRARADAADPSGECGSAAGETCSSKSRRPVASRQDCRQRGISTRPSVRLTMSMPGSLTWITCSSPRCHRTTEVSCKLLAIGCQLEVRPVFVACDIYCRCCPARCADATRGLPDDIASDEARGGGRPYQSHPVLARRKPNQPSEHHRSNARMRSPSDLVELEGLPRVANRSDMLSGARQSFATLSCAYRPRYHY